MKCFLARHSLLVGLALMFLVTWPIELSNSGVLPFKIPFFVTLLVGWGFIFVSLLMTWLTLGQQEAVRLFKRFLLWRVGWQWYLVALWLAPALQFAAVLLASWMTGIPVDYGQPLIRQVVPGSAPLFHLIVPWFLFEFLTNGEEMGWRGYILPRLQARHSALLASLIVGVIWSVWHLPKFLGAGTSAGRSLIWFTLFLIAASVLYTWLYNNSRGSLLLVTLFHASSNTSGMFLPISYAVQDGVTQSLLAMLTILAVVLVTIVAGPARLSRAEGKQIQG